MYRILESRLWILKKRFLWKNKVTKYIFVGYGDWKRLWGVLSRDRITFWKYPEDRDDLPAEGHISLRTIINLEVKTAKRALTSRPNTLELYGCPLKEGELKKWKIDYKKKLIFTTGHSV